MTHPLIPMDEKMMIQLNDFLSGSNPWIPPSVSTILQEAMKTERTQIQDLALRMAEDAKHNPDTINNGDVFLRYCDDMHFNMGTYLDTIFGIPEDRITEQHHTNYVKVVAFYVQFQAMCGMAHSENSVTQYLLGNYPEHEVIDSWSEYTFPVRGQLAAGVVTAPYPVAMLLGTVNGAMERYSKLVMASDNLSALYEVMSARDRNHFTNSEAAYIPFRSTIWSRMSGQADALGLMSRFRAAMAYGTSATDLTRLLERLKLEYAESGSIFTTSGHAQTTIMAIQELRNKHFRETVKAMRIKTHATGYMH